MRSTARVGLLLGLSLLAAGSTTLPRFRLARADNLPVQQPRELRPGLNPDQVRAILGPPVRKCRQIFSHRAREQWLYGPPRNLRLLFDCPQGQKPELRSFQPIPAHAP